MSNSTDPLENFIAGISFCFLRRGSGCQRDMAGHRFFLGSAFIWTSLKPACHRSSWVSQAWLRVMETRFNFLSGIADNSDKTWINLDNFCKFGGLQQPT